MEPTVEHRKHQRYPVRFKSIFSTDGAHLEEGLVLDLSLGGCRLTSAIHVPSGIPIEIHIRPDQHSPILYPQGSCMLLYVGGGIPSSVSSSKSYLNSNRQR